MYRQDAENTNTDTNDIIGYLFIKEKIAEKKLLIDFIAELYSLNVEFWK